MTDAQKQVLAVWPDATIEWREREYLFVVIAHACEVGKGVTEERAWQNAIDNLTKEKR